MVRYLKGTPGQGILLCSDCDLKIHGWCDSDWRGCRLTRRSLSGWFVTLRNSPISLKTKKHDVVARSSAEAEYQYMALTLCELKGLKPLLKDLGVDHTDPMSLACDNQVALYIVVNHVFYELTKHVEMDCHDVRDVVQDGTIKTRKVNTTAQLRKFLQNLSVNKVLNGLFPN